MSEHEMTYSSKEVAERLSIEPVTVRKYSQMLEEQGYEFKRDKNNWRIYSDMDIGFLDYIASMKKAGKSLHESVRHIAGLYQANLSISQPDTTLQEPQKQLKQFMDNQMAFNQKMLEKMEALDQRQAERDAKLMDALNQAQETQKQLAASSQKKWWKFWK